MSKDTASLDELCINTLRFLAVDAVEKAKSGHPGAPMGAAPMAYVLWDRFLKHNPLQPQWQNRDRFILSAGHASALLYALLHLTGYDLSLDDIKQFLASLRFEFIIKWLSDIWIGSLHPQLGQPEHNRARPSTIGLIRLVNVCPE